MLELAVIAISMIVFIYYGVNVLKKNNVRKELEKIQSIKKELDSLVLANKINASDDFYIFYESKINFLIRVVKNSILKKKELDYKRHSRAINKALTISPKTSYHRDMLDDSKINNFVEMYQKEAKIILDKLN